MDQRPRRLRATAPGLWPICKGDVQQMGTTDATQDAAGFAVSGDGVCHPREGAEAAQADTEFSDQADTQFAWAQDPGEATGLWPGDGDTPADISSRLSWAVTWG